MPEPSPGSDAAEGDPKKVDEAPDAKAPAESSPADPAKAEAEAKGGKEDSVLDAVKAALKDKSEDKSPESKKEPDPKSESDDPDAKKKDGEGSDDADELTEEDLSQLKAKTRKSFERLTASNAELKGKLETVEPKAVQFDRIVKFVSDAGLIPDEVNQLFDIGKNLKSNPRAAYEQIKPVYETLQRMFGDILPDDLQQRVNKGLLTAEDAKALAEARTNATVAEQSAKRLRDDQDRQRKQTDDTARVNEIQAKVTEWETSKEKADPDWKLKQPHVMRAIENAVLRRERSGQPPLTPADAVRMAEEALKAVNDEFKRLQPRPRAINTQTDVASTRSVPKPTTALEAARAGLARAHAG